MGIELLFSYSTIMYSLNLTVKCLPGLLLIGLLVQGATAMNDLFSSKRPEASHPNPNKLLADLARRMETIAMDLEVVKSEQEEFQRLSSTAPSKTPEELERRVDASMSGLYEVVTRIAPRLSDELQRLSNGSSSTAPSDHLADIERRHDDLNRRLYEAALEQDRILKTHNMAAPSYFADPEISAPLQSDLTAQKPPGVWVDGAGHDQVNGFYSRKEASAGPPRYWTSGEDFNWDRDNAGQFYYEKYDGCWIFLNSEGDWEMRTPTLSRNGALIIQSIRYYQSFISRIGSKQSDDQPPVQKWKVLGGVAPPPTLRVVDETGPSPSNDSIQWT